jgi:hypothetical protein
MPVVLEPEQKVPHPEEDPGLERLPIRINCEKPKVRKPFSIVVIG